MHKKLSSRALSSFVQFISKNRYRHIFVGVAIIVLIFVSTMGRKAVTRIADMYGRAPQKSSAPKDPVLPVQKTEPDALLAYATRVDNVADSRFYATVPVDNVRVTQAPNSWGTVLFFPQMHRMPGSTLDDAKNNVAATVQTQTYQILKYLLAQEPEAFDVVMVEGEITGAVPGEKKETLQRVLQERDSFSEQLGTVRDVFARKPFDAGIEKRILANAEGLLTKVNRRIILQGAPIALWAEGGSLGLMGAENKETLEESKTVVRNYLYLQDRIKTMTHAEKQAVGLSMGASFTAPVAAAPASSYRLLLQMLTKRSSLEADLQRLAREAARDGDTETQQLLRTFRTASAKLQNEKLQESDAAVASDTPSHTTPSRLVNPYATVTDMAVLKEKMKQSEKQINQLIIEKRNQETAENFSKALREQGETIGVLQYGAGHREGLTEALVARGLTVVQITPKAVAQAIAAENR